MRLANARHVPPVSRACTSLRWRARSASSGDRSTDNPPGDPSSPGSHWRGPARFTPGNEEDLQAPYLYDYLGEPWKTQELVRAIEGMFTTAPNGLPGSDDLGVLPGQRRHRSLSLYLGILGIVGRRVARSAGERQHPASTPATLTAAAKR